MNDDRQIKLYTTAPHPCSYFDDREAQTLFVDPACAVGSPLYTRLSQAGFRRSGSHYYRPNCDGCNACIASRVPVADFSLSRNQRRQIARNKDLDYYWRESLDAGAYPLYERYINERHRDGDMYPASREQFDSFIADSRQDTTYLHIYHQRQLLAVSVCDQMGDGLSAIYTFYAPEAQRRSLGKLAVLHMIETCRQRQLPYLYLGYWIRDCQKMRYKIDYRPLELLMSQRWVRLN